MSSSSDTGVSNTLDPTAIVSDDEILSKSEPFALPDDAPLADGPFDGDLPLILIPAPIPLAAFPLEDLPLDALSDDDIDLFIEGPPEGDQDGGAPMEDDIPVDDPVVPIDEAPVEEAPSDSSGPDSFESVAFASFHDRGVQHYSPDADSDMAMSATPVVPQDFGPKPEVEFVPAEPAPVGPEPVIAHDPIDVPVVPLLPDPLLEPDRVDPPVVAPPAVDAPVIAPPVVDHAPFATHIDPRYVDTLNGWIDDDDDYPPFVLPVTPPAAPAFAPLDIPQFHPHTSDIHRTDLPITFLQDIPPPRLGEGPSTRPRDHMPPTTAAFPFMPSFTPAAHTTSPFLQQDALSRRVHELERIPRPPPCHCQSPFATPPAPLPLHPDSDVRFLTPELQIAYLLRVVHALEEDWMPPRRDTRLPTTEAELRECISKATADYEASRAETSGGCTYKQFLDCKPLNYDGTGGAVAFVRWTEKTDSVIRMSKCAPENQVTYVSGLFLDGALSWWNLQFQNLEEAAAYALTWAELKELMRKKYCSRAEIQKLEMKF
ncbi:proline-rich protein 36-like [Helianthus annuus]|uniref:proline-rich protein 36-like n=1 Tax=Helianthus annuus TaxID=4232 RepID=UPI000B8F4E18|nr:proline-rich protein 36-like [Helianthus annuus]